MLAVSLDREANRGQNPNVMPTYRILSLDGAGIRGLLSIVLLDRLQRECPGWLRKVHLLAGTSTGGIIALGIAHGVPLADIRALYEQKGRDIFDDSWLDNLRDLGNVAGAQYGNKALTRELRRIFGDARLKDLSKRVLIPAFDLDNPPPPEATAGRREPCGSPTCPP